jgi:hypothetical protein
VVPRAGLDTEARGKILSNPILTDVKINTPKEIG